jgi:hypothetical protein
MSSHFTVLVTNTMRSHFTVLVTNTMSSHFTVLVTNTMSSHFTLLVTNNMSSHFTVLVTNTMSSHFTVLVTNTMSSHFTVLVTNTMSSHFTLLVTNTKTFASNKNGCLHGQILHSGYTSYHYLCTFAFELLQIRRWPVEMGRIQEWGTPLEWPRLHLLNVAHSHKVLSWCSVSVSYQAAEQYVTTAQNTKCINKQHKSDTCFSPVPADRGTSPRSVCM